MTHSGPNVLQNTVKRCELFTNQKKPIAIAAIYNLESPKLLEIVYTLH